VIIYPKSESQRRGIEKVVNTHIKWRKFDGTRVTIVKGPINSDGIVQFWSVPQGADAPQPVLVEETAAIIAEKAHRDRPNPYGTGVGTGTGETVKPEPGIGMAPRSGSEPILQSGNEPNPPGQPVVTDQPLKILSKPKANYTEPARANNVQGTVTLKVTFLANGNIGTVVPIKRLPNGLTEEAESAARLIRFEPAMKNGVPVTTTKTLEYPFIIY
jgi:TonB family protein